MTYYIPFVIAYLLGACGQLQTLLGRVTVLYSSDGGEIDIGQTDSD